MRATITFDADTLRALKTRAAHLGLGESKLVERAVREYLGLDVLVDPWQHFGDLLEDEAMELALDLQRKARDEMREERGAATSS